MAAEMFPTGRRAWRNWPDEPISRDDTRTLHIDKPITSKLVVARVRNMGLTTKSSFRGSHEVDANGEMGAEVQRAIVEFERRERERLGPELANPELWSLHQVLQTVLSHGQLGHQFRP